MKAKYGIADSDFYNFDETGFMMGVICGSMVVTRADRQGKSKSVQPGNRNGLRQSNASIPKGGASRHSWSSKVPTISPTGTHKPTFQATGLSKPLPMGGQIMRLAWNGFAISISILSRA